MAHATVGGLASEAQGGSFRHGFYSSAASAGIMHIKSVQRFFGDGRGGPWIAARTTAAAVIGGTASILAGGKFANGAVTSAFQQLFNAESAAAEERKGALMRFEKGQFSLAFADAVSKPEVLEGGDRIAGCESFEGAAQYYGKEGAAYQMFSNDGFANFFKRMEGVARSVALFAHGEQGRTGIGIAMSDTQWSALNGKVIDLYLFGCNVADGAVGRAYIQKVADLTGANVYASPYLVGYNRNIYVRTNYGNENNSDMHTVRMISAKPQ